MEQSLTQTITATPLQAARFPGLRPEHAHGPGAARLTELAQALVQDGVEAQFLLDPQAETSEDVDYEEFFEEAFRLSASLRAAHDAGLPTLVDGEARPRLSVRERTSAELLARRLGPVSSDEENERACDPLVHHPAFDNPEFLGRRIVLASYRDGADELDGRPARPATGTLPPSHSADLVDVLAGFVREGVPAAVVKALARKAGVVLVDLTDLGLALTDDELYRAVHRRLLDADPDFGWTLINHAGVPGGFMASPWIPMTHEYRVFLVDGVPVTGAAAIEEFTPLDRLEPFGQGDSFDRRTRELRANGVAAPEHAADQTCVTVVPGLVDRYLQRAHEIGASLPPERGTVVLDLALSDDRVVTVELNTLPNSGLYASDPYVLQSALINARDRGYWAHALRDEAFYARFGIAAPHTEEK